MRALYEIDADLMNCVDEETGEILDIEKLRDLEMERDSKIEGVACWYKNLVAEAEMLKTEKMKLAERQASAERQAEGLKIYLANALAGSKFESPKVKVGFRKSTSVNITDEAAVPDEFCKMTRTVSKSAILDALKAGETVSGAEIVERQNVQIK